MFFECALVTFRLSNHNFACIPGDFLSVNGLHDRCIDPSLYLMRIPLMFNFKMTTSADT